VALSLVGRVGLAEEYKGDDDVVKLCKIICDRRKFLKVPSVWTEGNKSEVSD
jgi:hypothetical protein